MSLRNEYGTWLGSALALALSLNPYDDIVGILNTTSGIIKEREGKLKSGERAKRAKQVLEFKFIGWDKKFYFIKKSDN